MGDTQSDESLTHLSNSKLDRSVPRRKDQLPNSDDELRTRTHVDFDPDVADAAAELLRTPHENAIDANETESSR